MTQYPHFHVCYSAPNNVWPQGCWSVYNIDCDEIAQRIGLDAEGKVIRRDSWPGYLGTYETLGEATTAIEERTNVLLHACHTP